MCVCACLQTPAGRVLPPGVPRAGADIYVCVCVCLQTPAGRVLPPDVPRAGADIYVCVCVFTDTRWPCSSTWRSACWR